MTPGEVAALVVVASAMSGREIPEAAEALWARLLADIDADVATRALQAHYAESTRQITPADIRQYAARLAVGAPDFDEAWGEVQRAIATFGSYRAPEFKNKITAAVVDAIGWRSICMTLESDVPTLRAHFRQMLESSSTRMVRAANVGALEAPRAGQLGAGDAMARLFSKKGRDR